MGSRKPRGPKDLFNMKIVKKSRSKLPIRVVRRRIQSEEYAASEIQRQTHHRGGSNKKSNESYKSTESMEEIVIPGDIPELDSLVVYEKELCSDFSSNGTGCLEPSGERRKKNGHKSCNKDESHDLNKSITDFVIPGDVPAIDSLMNGMETQEAIIGGARSNSRFYAMFLRVFGPLNSKNQKHWL
ncbi:hypothetical protein JHK87_003258 [Glycine soja]|nr:hypothetical protein JHK87_003258 [Glycine soja]